MKDEVSSKFLVLKWLIFSDSYDWAVGLDLVNSK